MKNISKIFALLLTLTTIFTLASCGGKENDSSEIAKPSSSGLTDDAGNPSGKNMSPDGKQEEKDNEGEIVIPSGGIELPIVVP